MRVPVRIQRKLTETFQAAACFHYETSDIAHRKLTAEEDRNIESFEALAASVKDIPDALRQQTADLATRHRDVFEQTLRILVTHVSDEFRPATATEFVERLNRHVENVAEVRT
jgi:hypothetical protein